MSGRRKGIIAAVMRAGLRVASIPYGFVTARRNKRYDQRKTEILSVDTPVISVGNLTTGGTGKTPVVCMLAKWFRERDIRVSIVSRGYGRGKQDQNDEAMELHARLPDVPHVQNPDRVEAARVAVDELAAQVILMDDGFQHRRLHRDLDIVVIDATCPFGYGHLLPRGMLREHINGLQRADLAMISKCKAASPDEIAAIEEQIQNVAPELQIILCNHQPTGLLEYPDQNRDIGALSGSRVAIVSAIGNPQSFCDTVTQLGASIVATYELPDHDAYAPETMKKLQAWASELDDDVTMIACTHKDLVKLQTDRIGGRVLCAVIIDLQILRGDEQLERQLNAIEIPPDEF